MQEITLTKYQFWPKLAPDTIQNIEIRSLVPDTT